MAPLLMVQIGDANLRGGAFTGLMPCFGNVAGGFKGGHGGVKVTQSRPRAAAVDPIPGAVVGEFGGVA